MCGGLKLHYLERKLEEEPKQLYSTSKPIIKPDKNKVSLILKTSKGRSDVNLCINRFGKPITNVLVAEL